MTTRARRAGRSTSRLVASTAILVVLAACSSDGREMKPPRPDQIQTIIDETTVAPAVVDESSADSITESSAVADVFTLSVPWTDGEPIPVDHTCSGDGVSPPIGWSGAPAGTSSYALVVSDLDAVGPTGAPLVHWVVANIDPAVTSIDAGGAVAGAIEGTNDLGRPDVPIVGWSPPCPPLGETHAYSFTLYAVSQPLDLVDGAPAADLIRAVELATVGSTTVTGIVTS